MAAHPFGPIENQLIRGYTKRDVSLAQMKPRFGRPSSTNIPGVETHAVWGFSSVPKLKIAEPAINKNSSYEFDVSICNFDLNLLSRGLGYRITFTMPADKEFNIEQPDTYPQVEFCFLDMFGDNVLSPVKICSKSRQKLQQVCKNVPSLMKIVNRAQSLIIEATIAHIKVTEVAVSKADRKSVV